MEISGKRRRPSFRTADNDVVREDLERFKLKALELGATAAEIIPASYVVVEERVRMKCLVPRCVGLKDGGTPYCPPNTPEPSFMRKVFSQYHWAIITKREIENPQDYVVTSEAESKEKGPKAKQRGDYHKKTHEIIGKLESHAQSEGYYLAMGFIGGTCRYNLCGGAICGVVENGNCRWPLLARPSMEAVGIDVFDLANKVGWDVYMIRHIEPDPVVIPCAVSIGIVFIY